MNLHPANSIVPGISLIAHATEGVWDHIALLPPENTLDRADLLPATPTVASRRDIFRRYDAVSGFEEDGIAWRVYSNSSGIASIPNDYRVYLNPAAAQYRRTLEVVLAAMTHPWFPTAAFKCIEYDPLGKLADPDLTKIVLYFDSPVHAATATWLLRRATDTSPLVEGASVLSDTIPITALVQTLGGRREHQRWGDPEVYGRNLLLWEALALRALV